MTGRWRAPILASPRARQPAPLPRPWRALVRLALGLALALGALLGSAGVAAAAADPLEQRLAAWPAWFAGEWQVSSSDAEGEGPALQWRARFRAEAVDGANQAEAGDGAGGGAVAERAFNARAIGRAALGAALLSVADDPANPNRQLTRLAGDQLLETTVVGRRSARSADGSFLADELSLQVLHGPGQPRIQRVEVLGRWQRRQDGGIDGEQWQASYPSPAEGLAAEGQRPLHLRLRLVPLPPGSDPAS